MRRIVSTPRGRVPEWCEYLTCAVDVHKFMCYYIVLAWKSDGTGHVVGHDREPRLHEVMRQRAPHVPEADEAHRAIKTGRPAYEDPIYPLVDMGIEKADEAAILARHGLDWVRKSGCFMCPFQPVGWFWALREWFRFRL